jgi:hypothetical protein
MCATICSRHVQIVHRASRIARIGVTHVQRHRLQEVMTMGSQRQVSAAKGNIKKAQRAARAKRTITKLPTSVRRDLGRQAAKSRQRGGVPGHALEDRTRQDLYEVAKKKNISGRSSMGKWELIRAIRKAN